MKQFELEQVGKRLPYSVPDGFFDKLEDDVMQEVKKETVRPGWRTKALRIVFGTMLAVSASIALFLVVRPMLPKSSADYYESVELAFSNLSPEDQDFLLQVYEEDDLFINQ